ncbi:hypothetical protein HYH02_002179 [Chlamydomonas schloesseri]|uniref:Protein kinase domain-containing protein n=1 Tax=Chlamydomonas schloesseri TaxID=2026947 RepID=A0A835WRK4_9CHLO|nr:hypothetical protein HYH02_002179 [Chlamydomonas schloesseri]|eukprot:KAG2452833.1 hypothetical protein HYH02_002179 [Chlamydomonas schloesseri]
MFRRLSARPGSCELLDSVARGDGSASGEGVSGSPAAAQLASPDRKPYSGNAIRAKLKKALFGTAPGSSHPSTVGGPSSCQASAGERRHASSEWSARTSAEDAGRASSDTGSANGALSNDGGAGAPPTLAAAAVVTTTTTTTAQPAAAAAAATAATKPAKGLLSLLLRRGSSRKGAATATCSARAGTSSHSRAAAASDSSTFSPAPATCPSSSPKSPTNGEGARPSWSPRAVVQEPPVSPSPALVLPIPTTPSPFSAAAATAAAAAAAATAATAAAAHDDDHRPPNRVLTCPQIGQHLDSSLHHQGQSLTPGAAEGSVGIGIGVGVSIGVSAISAVQPLLPQCPWEPAVCCSGSSTARLMDGFSSATTMATTITSDASVRPPVTPAFDLTRGTPAGSSGTAGCDIVRPSVAAIPVPEQAAALAAVRPPSRVVTATAARCSPAVQVAATSPSFPAAMAAAAEAAQAEAEEAYAAACRGARACAAAPKACLSRSAGPASALPHLRHHVHPQHHHYSPQLAPPSHQQHQLLYAGSAKENSSSSSSSANAGQVYQQQSPADALMSLGPFSPSVHDAPSVLQPPPPLHHPQPLRHQPLTHTRSHAWPLQPVSSAAHGSSAADTAAGGSNGAFWSGTSAPTPSSCHHLLAARHLLPHAAAFSACAEPTSAPMTASNTSITGPLSPPLTGAAGATLPLTGASETKAAHDDGDAAAAVGSTTGTAGASQLLATSMCTPPAMQRPVWRMEDYALTRRLYRGRMASVYKGRCLRSGLPVALKVYFKQRVAPNVAHMVMREAALQLRTSAHRFVLKLYGVFQTEELVVFVCELASRGSLAQLVGAGAGGASGPGGRSRCTRLTETQLRQAVLEPLLDSLCYLHGMGVCHRDIKPENLLFTSNWDFRLADFGVSIDLSKERAVTRAGTAEYMAPEVERCPLKANADDNKHDATIAYTTAADIWSVGVLAYELLVGFPPALGLDAPSIRSATDASAGGGAGSSAADISFPTSISAVARDFITQALALRPEDRPTVHQLRAHPWMRAVARLSVPAAAGAPGDGYVAVADSADAGAA